MRGGGKALRVNLVELGEPGEDGNVSHREDRAEKPLAAVLEEVLKVARPHLEGAAKELGDLLAQ